MLILMKGFSYAPPASFSEVFLLPPHASSSEVFLSHTPC